MRQAGYSCFCLAPQVVCKGGKYFLRPIGSLYCAGQTQPLLRVPAPNSKEQGKYQRRHLINFIHNRLRNGGSMATTEVSDTSVTIAYIAI